MKYEYIFVLFATWLVLVNGQEYIQSILQGATEISKRIVALGNQFPECVFSRDVNSYNAIQQALTNCGSFSVAVINTEVNGSSQQIPDYCSQAGAQLASDLLAFIQRNIEECIERNKVPTIYLNNEDLNVAKNNVVRKAQAALNNISKNSGCLNDETQIKVVQILNDMEYAGRNCTTNPDQYLECFYNAVANANNNIDLITAWIEACVRQSQ